MINKAQTSISSASSVASFGPNPGSITRAQNSVGLRYWNQCLSGSMPDLNSSPVIHNNSNNKDNNNNNNNNSKSSSNNSSGLQVPWALADPEPCKKAETVAAVRGSLQLGVPRIVVPNMKGMVARQHALDTSRRQQWAAILAEDEQHTRALTSSLPRPGKQMEGTNTHSNTDNKLTSSNSLPRPGKQKQESNPLEKPSTKLTSSHSLPRPSGLKEDKSSATPPTPRLPPARAKYPWMRGGGRKHQQQAPAPTQSRQQNDDIPSPRTRQPGEMTRDTDRYYIWEIVPMQKPLMPLRPRTPRPEGHQRVALTPRTRTRSRSRSRSRRRRCSSSSPPCSPHSWPGRSSTYRRR